MHPERSGDMLLSTLKALLVLALMCLYAPRAAHAQPGTFTLSNNAPVCDTAPPAGPAVQLNWTSSSGAASYTLFRNGSAYSSGITQRSFYNSANLVAGQTYTYFVRATGTSGTRDSNTISVNIPAAICSTTPQPGAFTLSNQTPVCDTAAPAGPAVRLNWTGSSNATAYTVFRNGSAYASGISGLTYYNSASIVAGQTYTYFVRATNTSGTRDSNTITVSIPSGICTTTPQPGSFTLSNQTPVCDSAPPAGPAVRLDWTGSSNATAYTVFRNGSAYASGISGLTFYNNTSVAAGQSYTYFVRATNTTGTRDSNTITVNIPAGVCGTSPQPGAFTLSGETPVCNSGSPALRLNWSASANATTYTVYRNGVLYAGGVGGLTYLNSANVAAGQTYAYFIRATNTSGTRDSNTVTVSVPANICASAPGVFTLSIETPACLNGAPMVRLTWTPSSNSSSYAVYRNGAVYASGITGTAYSNISGVSAGSSYTYTVRAVNSIGTRDSNTLTTSVPLGICGPIVQVATPSFNVGESHFIGSIALRGGCTTTGAIIHYTDDGRTPTEADPVMPRGTGPALTLTHTRTIRLRAFAPGKSPSEVKARTFTKGALDGTVTLHSPLTGDLNWTVSLVPFQCNLPNQPNQAIMVHGKKTWLIIHGRQSSPNAAYVQQLATALAAHGGDGEQVVLADWSSIAAEYDLITLLGNTPLTAAADEFSSLLTSVAISGRDRLEIAGHSWGAYVGERIKNALTVDRFIALDPALAGDGTEGANFASNSTYSWAFYGSWYGSAGLAATADDSFVIRWTNSSIYPDTVAPALQPFVSVHNGVVSVFADLVRSSAFGGKFLPSNMGQRLWTADRYLRTGDYWTLGAPKFDAVFYARLTPDGGAPASAYRLNYFDLTDTRVWLDNPMSAPAQAAGATIAHCPGDFSQTGAPLDMQDVVEYTNAWFAREARADFNSSGSLDAQDIFDFLNAWVAGCP